MSLKMTILGLLLDEPAHGYALKRKISPALEKDQLVNDGVLYPLLAKLEKRGWLESKVEKVKGRPDRKVFHVTDSGRNAFDEWLAGDEDEESVTFDFFSGHPFLTKVMFFERLDTVAIRAKLESQHAAAKEKLARFRKIKEGMAARNVSPFRIAIIDLGINEQRARIRWLAEQRRKRK